MAEERAQRQGQAKAQRECNEQITINRRLLHRFRIALIYNTYNYLQYNKR